MVPLAALAVEVVPSTRLAKARAKVVGALIAVLSVEVVAVTVAHIVAVIVVLTAAAATVVLSAAAATVVLFAAAAIAVLSAAVEAAAGHPRKSTREYPRFVSLLVV